MLAMPSMAPSAISVWALAYSLMRRVPLACSCSFWWDLGFGTDFGPEAPSHHALGAVVVRQARRGGRLRRGLMATLDHRADCSASISRRRLMREARRSARARRFVVA